MSTHAGKEVIQSIRDKFQFLAVITLFFPVTLQAVFSGFQQDIQANYQIMSWGIVVAVIILNYLAIEYLKDKMPNIAARYIEIFIRLSLLSYVPVFLVFSMFKAPSISYYYAIAMGVGIMGIMILPMLIFVILILCLARIFLREEISWTYKVMSRNLPKRKYSTKES